MENTTKRAFISLCLFLCKGGRTCASMVRMCGSLLSYLSQAGFNVQRVVVERNGAIITREHFAETLLADDDSLEVVQFVGGG